MAEHRGSTLVVVAGVASGVAFVLAPDGGVAQAAVFVAMAALAAGSVVARVIRDRLRGPWLFLAAGALVYAVATVCWASVPTVFDADLPFPSYVDVLYFASYGLYAMFLVRLIRVRSERRQSERRLGVLDAAIFTTAATPVIWEALLQNQSLGSGARLLEQAFTVGYPAFILLLFAVAVRLVISDLSVGAVGRLLLGWIALELVADTLYAYASAHDGFQYGANFSLLWLASYTCLAALALHPALPRVAEPVPTSAGRRRLGALLAASLVPLGMTLNVAGEPRPETIGFVVITGMVFTLVFVRLNLVTGDLAEQRRLAAELARATDELRYQSLHDQLTGTGNRSMLLLRLAHALQRRQPWGRTTALALLDLDSFKIVNDTLGHEAGDLLLQQVAERLKTTVRPADTVARLGGDEFAMVLEDVEPQQALRVTRRIVDALHEPMDVAGRTVRSRASVGLFLAERTTEPAVALRSADLAMYAAKAAGGDRYEVFEPALHEAFLARHRMELDLREAAARGQLRLYYQPVMELEGGTVDGVEALLRWEHADLGMLGPGQFMPVAEESGAIIEIGRWVLREACRQVVSWRDAGLLPPGFQMAVNLSRRQLLDPNVVADIVNVVRDTGARPSELVVEVTETALMADTAVLTDRLDQISRLGVTIAMDDFGTGYSSLDQLRRLPVDILKIDRAFVQGIDSGNDDFALATAIIRLAASLGKLTVAEGVETPAQLAHLRALRAGKAQGFLFARPLPPDEAAAFIEARATRRMHA